MPTAGPRNRIGPPGLSGIPGKNGINGEDGINGKNGKTPAYEWRGTEIRFKKPNGDWGSWTDLRGPSGPSGAPGNGSGEESSFDVNSILTGPTDGLYAGPIIPLSVLIDNNGNVLTGL